LRLFALWLYLLSATFHLPAHAAERPLIFGIFPHLTARQTVEIYRPLADAMAKRLQRPVLIYSARDFTTFVARTRQGEYDILLTAPHLAWLARQETGYRPLLKYSQPARGLLVVKAGSPFRSPGDLRGRTIATADAIAVAVLALQADLAAHGLQHDSDYRTVGSSTHTNAMMQVINGHADAAIVGSHPYQLASEGTRRQLRILIETPALSSLMYLTHPRLRDHEAQTIHKALIDFEATPEGRTFMLRGGYGEFSAVGASELHAFRPYAQQAQEMLRETR
jgi:phosphonate transport system substrate-binding protein